MNTPTRTLTIEDFNPNGRVRPDSASSLIRLKGCWLRTAGFHSGAQITVSNPSPGVIDCAFVRPLRIDASFFTVMQQLDAVLK